MKSWYFELLMKNLTGVIFTPLPTGVELKNSNEDVIKVNQMMPYTECRSSHSALMHDKKMFVRSRTLIRIKHTTPCI